MQSSFAYHKESPRLEATDFECGLFGYVRKEKLLGGP